MLYVLSALVLSLLPLASAQDNDTATILTALQNSKVIPDVIPANFTPRFPLDVVFTSNGSTFPVTAGANLTEAQTSEIPSFAIVSNNTAIIGKPYLIAIVDADAPSPPNRSRAEFRHFLAADYIADNNTNGEFVMHNKSTKATLTDYVPPTPANTSAPHRYVVLCYLQNQTGLDAPANFNASNRTNFNITTFANQLTNSNNVTLLGATFFWVSANDTTGSVAPNSTNGGPAATAPAGAGGAGGAGGSSDAVKVGVALAWTFVGMFTASAALLL